LAGFAGVAGLAGAGFAGVAGFAGAGAAGLGAGLGFEVRAARVLVTRMAKVKAEVNFILA